MRKIFYVFLSFAIALTCVCFIPTHAQAAATDPDRTYNFSAVVQDRFGNTGTVTLQSNTQVYAYIYNGYLYFADINSIGYGAGSGTAITVLETTYPGGYFPHVAGTTVSNIPYDPPWGEKTLSYVADFPVFSDFESCKAYIQIGDTSGMLNKPEVDWSGLQHDFSSDQYVTEIPVPVLSNFSFNGFTVDNSQDDLFIDVIVESGLYKVEHVKTSSSFLFGDSYKCLPGASTFSRHYFNFADLSDVAVNNHVISFPDLWGVDNAAILLDDFSQWSSLYPHHWDLPDYDRLKHLNNSTMIDNDYTFNYTNLGNLGSSVERLRNSGLAFTNYKVRFYDANLNYSQWVSYTYSVARNESGFIGDKVEVSVLEENGGIAVFKKKLEGNQVYDPETGNSSISYKPYNPYSSGSSFSNLTLNDLDPTSMLDSLTNVVSAFGSLPQLYRDVFVFLPEWIINMIAVGLAAIVVLRLIGR